VLLLNVLCRRWLTAGQLGLLWSLVLLRLLMPTAPSSPFSLQNFVLTSEMSDSPPADGRVWAVTRPDREASSGDESTFRAAASPVLAHPTRMPVARGDALEFLLELLPLVWLAGAVAVFAWTLWTHARFCRRVRRAPICRNERVLRLWDDACRQARVRNTMPVIFCDDVPQPAVMGMLHAELLLPADAQEWTDETLRMVMLHELAHVRRHDIALNWGLVVLRALHWWNPLFWLASARFQNLREQACDAFVVRQTAGDSGRAYGELLLSLAQRAPSHARWRVLVPASLLGLFTGFFRKRALRSRLHALHASGRVRGRWQAVLAAASVLLIGLCGLTDAEHPAVVPADMSPPPFGLPHAIDWTAWSLPGNDADEPAVTHVYAIDDKLKAGWAKTPHAADWDYRREIPSLIELIAGPHRPQRPGVNAGDTPRPRAFFRGDIRLVVSAPESVHREVAELMQAWKTSGLQQISIGCRIINSSRELATAAGIEWQSIESATLTQDEPSLPESRSGETVVQASARTEEHLPVFVVPLDDRQVESILNIAKNEPKTNVIHAPKVTLFNGQQATISDCTWRPFVVGMKQVSGKGLEPRVEVIDEGLKLTLRSVVQEDLRHVSLRGTVELSNIVNVSQMSSATARGIESIQVPRVTRCRIQIASSLEDGRSLLVGCLPNFDRKDCFYVLLTVRTLSEADMK
jgi:bla regulator protein blaR1